MNSSSIQMVIPMKKTAPKIVTFEMKFVLRLKICPIVSRTYQELETTSSNDKTRTMHTDCSVDLLVWELRGVSVCASQRSATGPT